MRRSCAFASNGSDAFAVSSKAKSLFCAALATVTLAWLIQPVLAGVQPASGAKTSRAEVSTPVQAAAPSYFVEFRARTHFYGHVYVAYGTLNERGEPANFLIAGLYPDGGAAGFALGHIVPVPASVDGIDDDRNLPSQAVYRRNLSADDYGRLLTGIQNLRNRPHVWHALTYNCVIFAALIADSIGLKAPSVLILPVPFVELLRMLNDP